MSSPLQREEETHTQKHFHFRSLELFVAQNHPCPKFLQIHLFWSSLYQISTLSKNSYVHTILTKFIKVKIKEIFLIILIKHLILKGS